MGCEMTIAPEPQRIKVALLRYKHLQYWIRLNKPKYLDLKGVLSQINLLTFLVSREISNFICT